MNLVVPLGNRKLGKFSTWSTMAYDYWTHLINYRSFCQLNKRKLGGKRAGIVFSKYLANLIPGSHLIYHGSERSILDCPNKKEARKLFCIPEDTNVALASGFMTATKGWDIIRKMEVPDGWNIVVNTSKNHHNRERRQGTLNKQGVIQLDMGFLSEEQLSLLFHCADILILPYKVSSGSGVMFDGFAHHHLPFVSSNIEFFREFSEMGLGIAVDRDLRKFCEALLEMERNMNKYKKSVELFSKKIIWKEVALKHKAIYESMLALKPPLLNKSVYIAS